MNWTRNQDRWTARSHDGTEVRIYLYQGRKDVFAVEGRLGNKTYASATDASKAIANSAAPAKTRRKILETFRVSAEGYVLRYETTGIQDPLTANDTIRRMNGLVWHRLLNEWRRKNPDPSAPMVTTTKAPKQMIEEKRMVYLRFFIDANRINSKRKLTPMNRLEEWARRRVIEILMSETAAEEAAVGDALRRKKARSYMQTLNEVETRFEMEQRARIEAALLPSGITEPGQANDVEIVLNASKYGGRLITNDGNSKRQPGGILGARDRLDALGIHVMTDAEACELVESRIRDRDERARREAAETGLPLPEWVGVDGSATLPA